MTFKDRLERVLVDKGFSEPESIDEEELVGGVPNSFVIGLLSEEWGKSEMSTALTEAINDLIEYEALECEMLDEESEDIENVLLHPDIIDKSVEVLKDYEDEVYAAYEDGVPEGI